MDDGYRIVQVIAFSVEQLNKKKGSKSEAKINIILVVLVRGGRSPTLV